LHLKKRTSVDYAFDDGADVVGHRGAVGNDVVHAAVPVRDFQFGFSRIHRSAGFKNCRADKTLRPVRSRKHRPHRWRGSAQRLRQSYESRRHRVLHTDVFTGDGFDDVGAGDKHLTGFIDHDDEIGEGRRVDRTTCCGPTNNRNLGNHPRSLGIAFEDFAIFPSAITPSWILAPPESQDAYEGTLVGEGEVRLP